MRLGYRLNSGKSVQSPLSTGESGPKKAGGGGRSKVRKARDRYSTSYKSDPLFEFSGIARVERPEVRDVELDGNRCVLGNLTILSVKRLKPIVRAVQSPGTSGRKKDE